MPQKFQTSSTSLFLFTSLIASMAVCMCHNIAPKLTSLYTTLLTSTASVNILSARLIIPKNNSNNTTYTTIKFALLMPADNFLCSRLPALNLSSYDDESSNSRQLESLRVARSSAISVASMVGLLKTSCPYRATNFMTRFYEHKHILRFFPLTCFFMAASLSIIHIFNRPVRLTLRYF